MVPVNAILSGSIREIEVQIKDKRARGFQVYKLKIGNSIEDDLEKVKFVAGNVAAGSRLRLDANRAYDASDAAVLLDRLRDFDIEFIEEPLQPKSLHLLSELHKKSGFPFALDDSLTDLLDIQGLPSAKLLELAYAEAFDVAVIKPTITGGVLRSLDLIEKLGSLGIKAVISSTIESGVGSTALLHLAASMRERYLACGFDTLSLLEHTLIEEDLKIENGFMCVPNPPGLGVTVTAFEKAFSKEPHTS